MRLILITAAAAAALAIPAAASAQSNFAGVRASTLGLGVEAGWNVNDHVMIRGLLNGANVNYHTDSEDIRYDGKLKLGSAGVQVDYRFSPDGPLYVTAGLYANGNKVDATATPTSNAEVGGVTYTPAQIGTLTARGKFNGAAPYLGIGARWPVGSAMTISLEAGAYFQGTPKVTLTSNGTYASNPAYQSSLEQERRELEDDIKDAKTWPVVALGVGWRF